jgi:hypothetical protein
MARPSGIKETKPRNTVARKVAAAAAEQGITPLDLMLAAMREDWDAAQAMLRDARPQDPTEADRWTARVMALRSAAIATADKAAPYLHPRLASTDTTIKSDNVHRVIADKPMDEDAWIAEHAAPANDIVAVDSPAEDESAA